MSHSSHLISSSGRRLLRLLRLAKLLKQSPRVEAMSMGILEGIRSCYSILFLWLLLVLVYSMLGTQRPAAPRSAPQRPAAPYRGTRVGSKLDSYSEQ